jgi:hypothetical protein
LTEQMQNIRQLDAKMVQVFAAAGVGIGLAGFSRGVTPGSRAVDVLLTIAVLAYLAAGGLAARHLWTRRYAGLPDPAIVLQDSWHEEADTIRHNLTTNINRAFATNAAVSLSKGRTLRWAIVAAAIEFAFIGFAIIAARWA